MSIRILFFYAVVILSTLSTRAQSCSAFFSYNNSGLIASFYDLSLGASSNTQYSWKFGDGDSSMLKEPVHTYQNSGIFQVCLTISDSINCTSTICDSIIVSNFSSNCDAAFNFSIDKTNSVIFTDQTTPISNYTYKWDFGDSTFSSFQNPTHNYKKTGIYPVKLKAYIPGAASCITSDTLYVNYCESKFNYTSLSRDSMHFKGIVASSNSSSIHWDFGDGKSTFGNLNPKHRYSSSGLFTVTLSVFDSTSNTSCSYADTVRIKAPKICQIGFKAIVNDSNLHVLSTAKNFTNIFYSFGNGDSSFVDNPIYTYKKNGVYSVCQTVYNATTNCTKTTCDTVTINVPKACLADFDLSLNLDTLEILNKAKSYNSIVYSLSNGITLSHPNAKIILSNNGPLQVCQFIKNSVNNCRDTLCKTINIVLPPKCTASFNYTQTGPTVQFKNNARFYDFITYYFGDGDSSIIENPEHLYQNSGTYLVRQKVVNKLTNCESFFEDSINVFIPPRCLANFSVTIVADSVSIRDLSSNNNYCRYDFGDGFSTTNRNPKHTYSRNGTYRICQTVIDTTNNCESIKCLDVSIVLPKICDPNFDAIVVQDSLFILNKATNYNQLEYSFGDGNSSSESNPVYIFKNSGTYQVCQTVFNERNNCQKTQCKSIAVTVPPKCLAGFEYSIKEDTVRFANTASFYEKVFYDFGDGKVDSIENPQHVYDKNGLYVVRQTVFGKDGNCVNVFHDTIEISVQRLCQAKYQIALDTSKRGTLYLINTSTKRNSHNYLWNFGDGETSNGRTPTHKYENFGLYNICLYISDDDLGCMSSYCEEVGLDSNGYLLKNKGFLLRVLDGSFVGLDEESDKEKHMNIYPNPTKNSIQIESNMLINSMAYELLDVNGKIKAEGLVNEANNTIELSHIQPGMYFIRLWNSNQFVVKRIIKQ
ncbi:MAG: hypothetical protein CMO34_01270 [Verrucomicrobia bacterium]|nr:hypothetical protein [Verrucomicrobiota bacterium]